MNSFAYNSTGDSLLAAAESILQGSLTEDEDFYSQKMIENQLQTIVRNSNTCLEMIEADRKFPEWAQSEIAVAEDGIVSVTEYMQSHSSDKVDEAYKVGFPLAKKAIKAATALDPDEFKEFLGGMANYFYEVADADGTSEFGRSYIVKTAMHFEQAYKAWPTE